MNSAGAIFIKQFQDILKNSSTLVQFIIFPVMAFLMTYIVDIDTGGAMPESFFITMKAAMFIGMTLVSTTATVIAEDREKNSLRFLLMAGVKSHEYLLGVGGVVFACALVVSGAFSAMMPNVSVINMLTMFVSLSLGAAASILLGGIIGMKSDNEQSAISISSAAGMVLGFGPMIANLSGNATLENIFGIFYTMNFVYEDIRTTGVVRSFGIILANITVLIFGFAWVYGKQESRETREKGVFIVNKKVIAVLSSLALAGGGGIAFALWHNAGFVTTDNARVTTTLIAIAPSAPGHLERFTIREGSQVRENEILGWVENGETMRSPIDGLVIHTNAVLDQHVTPAEPVAIIADVSNIHILANIEESDIARVRAGQPVTITIDTFGRQRFNGYVRNIGRITQAELGGNPVFFNISGVFTRLTHLIPVEINITDDVDLSGIIGVNANVRIALRSPAGNLRHVTGAVTNGGAARSITKSITARGTVESVQRRIVYSTLGAVIERVYVEAGDRVTEGQMLAALAAEDLDIQIANAQAALQIAEVNVGAAQHNHEIRGNLYGARVIARDELRQAEFALQSALASRQQAQAALDAARFIRERSVITAVICGTVTTVAAREGAAGTGLLFIIEDTDNLRIAASFREYDLSRIHAGMEVAISSNATGNTEYSGVITRINPAATVLSSAAEFEAEVLVTSPNSGLRIGTNARINVRLE